MLIKAMDFNRRYKVKQRTKDGHFISYWKKIEDEDKEDKTKLVDINTIKDNVFDDAISNYMSSSYTLYNGYLRKWHIGKIQNTNSEIRYFNIRYKMVENKQRDVVEPVESLRYNLGRSIKYEGVLHRGLHSKEAYDNYDNLDIGDLYEEESFISMSKSEDMAKDFAQIDNSDSTHAVLFKIDAKGKYSVDVSEKSKVFGFGDDENEVIGNAKARFRILDKKKGNISDVKVLFIHMEEV